MYTKETQRLVWEHEIRLRGGVYSPASALEHSLPPMATLPSSAPRMAGRAAPRRVLVMVSEGDKSWYESEAAS